MLRFDNVILNEYYYYYYYCTCWSKPHVEWKQ